MSFVIYLVKYMFMMQRNYNVYLPHNKIPDALIQLARKMAAPAMSTAEEFKPEAAIVNYFGLGISNASVLLVLLQIIMLSVSSKM